MAYQQDLVHRGGPTASRHHRQSQNSYRDYDDDEPNPPRVQEPHYRGRNQWYPLPRSQHSRPNHPRKDARISFEEALADLFDLLNASLAFYSNFKREFDDEIQGVSAYADPMLLKELWVSRIDYMRGHHDTRDPRDREGPRERAQAPQDFKNAYLRLKERFEIAIRAAPARRGQRAAHDDGRSASYERIVQKLGAGHRDISRLAQSARTRRGEVEALVMELEFLITYLEKNKGVWADGGPGEDGRYEEHGDGGTGGQETCE
ncbi:hypothetical protein MMC30_006031 [Trapelia coarctata]|nr:hypothetical protein [Trapelia coarctata]